MEFSLEDIDRLSPKYVNSLFKINNIMASEKAIENKLKIIEIFYKAGILNQSDRKFVENYDFKNLYVLPLRQLVRISKNITFIEAKKKGLTRGQIVKKIILERLIMERRREYIKIPPEISEIIFSDLDINTIKKLLATQYFVLPEKYYKIIENIKSYKILQPEKNYYKVLYKASEKGHIEVIKYLIRQKPDLLKLRVDEKVPGRGTVGGEALKLASENGNLDVVKYLVKQGVRIIPRALELASGAGHFDIVKYFIEQGFDVNNSVAVNNASEGGHSDIIKYLVGIGANINEGNLMYAISKGHLDIVKYFVEGCGFIGAGIPIEALVFASTQGRLDMVKYLIERGSYIHGSSLFAASKGGHLNVVKYLIEEHELEIHKNVLRVASKEGHLEILKFLIKNYKSGNLNNDILKDAAQKGHLNVVKYLVEQNLVSNITDNILKETLAKDHIEVVKYLMKKKYGDTVESPPKSNVFNIAKVI